MKNTDPRRAGICLSSSTRSGWLLLAILLTISTTLLAQSVVAANRISQALGAGTVATSRLEGSVHPLTRYANDLGAVSGESRLESMSLNIGLSATQQKDLNTLLAAQQNPKSPLYHQWLTQEQFGARFGLSDSDLAKATAWLEARGFTVTRIAPSRNQIVFSGTVAEAEAAFRTSIHQYSHNGVVTWNNATPVYLPEALSGVVSHVGGISGFRPKTHLRAAPQFTSEYSGKHFLTPGDWATIYNVTPIYSAGYTGSGMHIGVVGQTYLPKADVDSFRAASGLSSTKLTYKCISSSHCTDSSGISQGDQGEADLDVEWAGGIAKEATVDYIYTSAADTTSNGVYDALVYGITTYKVSSAVVPVISMSYGNCETDLVGYSSYRNQMDTYLAQAASQGQTILNSSGDAGAAGCDQGSSYSTGGAVTDWPASSPNVVAIGGTTFSGDGSDTYTDAYWTGSSSSDIISSAIQYIPETAWNDTATDGTLASTGGGVSEFYSMPSWQWAPSNYTGSNMRFVPDVSFSASADHDAYLVCTLNTEYGIAHTCYNNTFRYSDSNFYSAYGGTSASTPSFAGVLTLLVQKYGKLGNVSQTLYPMAANATKYAAIFHDITSGSNIQPCVSGTGCSGASVGYSSLTGYDLTTGLGSVNSYALYTALGNTTSTASTSTSVSTSPVSVNLGSTVTLTANVTSTTSGTITGSVTFKVGSTTLGTATLSGGSASLSNVAVSSSNGFAVGSDTITASYGGDSSYSGSANTTVLTVTNIPATTTNLTLTPSTVTLGGTTSVQATVTSTTAGTITGQVSFSVGSTSLGTANLSGGVATLNSVAVTVAKGFSAGSDTITASYAGDTNFAASSATASLTVNGATTSTTLSASPNSVKIDGSTSLTAIVTPSSATGTVAFKLGSTSLGSATLSGGTATLSNVAVTVSKGFSAGSDTITASYAGDSSDNSSSGTLALTVGQASSTTTVTASSQSVTYGSSVSLTATLSSAAATGTVTFSNGSTTLGTATVNNGVASLAITASSTTLQAGANTITAVYSGDTNYATSNSTVAITMTPTYSLSAVTTTTISAGSSGTVALSLTSQGYSGTVSFVTTTSSSAITASASSVTLTSGATGGTTLTINTTTTADNRKPAMPWKAGGAMVFALVLGVPMTLRRKRAAAVLLTFAAIVLLGFSLACGGGGSSTKAARTYTVSITPTGSGTVTNPSALTVTVTVP